MRISDWSSDVCSSDLLSGLGLAVRLKQAGIENFEILERADNVGGTWRDNRYPGCACDVQSHLYSFSFEQNPDWTRMYAQQPEIERYLQGVAGKYGLLPHVRFGANVVGARYDEAAALWRVEAQDGRNFRGRGESGERRVGKGGVRKVN